MPADGTPLAAPQPLVAVLLFEWIGVFGSEFPGDGLDEAGVEVELEASPLKLDDPVVDIELFEEIDDALLDGRGGSWW